MLSPTPTASEFSAAESLPAGTPRTVIPSHADSCPGNVDQASAPGSAAAAWEFLDIATSEGRSDTSATSGNDELSHETSSSRANGSTSRASSTFLWPFALGVSTPGWPSFGGKSAEESPILATISEPADRSADTPVAATADDQAPAWLSPVTRLYDGGGVTGLSRSHGAPGAFSSSACHDVGAV